MDETEVIIVGAGACGLIAALELLKAGKTVKIIEANAWPGGRIYTMENGMECGAEFVHGKLPVTERLIKESGSSLIPVEGKMYENKNGKWKEQENFVEGWDEMMKCLSGLKEDLSLKKFLDQYFNEGKYTELRMTISRFAEGYDLVDLDDASVLALKKEWEEGDDDQCRVKGGYCEIINYLVKQIIDCKGSIEYETPVNKIEWKENNIKVIAGGNKTFQSRKILITVSPGVWKKGETAEGFIHFDPAIPEQLDALKNIGFGNVIKFIFDFSESFWNKKAPNAGFVFCNEKIPVWWTYLPTDKTRITGWFGGPPTVEYEYADEETLLQLALSSLSRIFEKSESSIKHIITAYRIINWNNLPYIYGGYSYTTLNTTSARDFLKTPVAGSIFFGGEGLYEGPYSGMVEAAFQNGIDVAGRILGK